MPLWAGFHSLWRSYIILGALPCFLVQQAHLILFPLKPHNQLFLQGALVPFSGEWMVLQVKLWTCCCWDVAASGPFQWAEAADVCTHITIFISIYHHIPKIMSLHQYLQFQSDTPGFILVFSLFIRNSFLQQRKLWFLTIPNIFTN